MIAAGDTVMVVSAANGIVNSHEFIPVGTVCRVLSVRRFADIGEAVEIVPADRSHESDTIGFWYAASEVEKGKLVWVRDKRNRSKT